MRLAHWKAHRVAGRCEFIGTIEHEIEPALQNVEIFILIGMDVRRHESARRKGRMPGEAVLAAILRHIGLAENIPGNALNAFIGARDACDLGVHVMVFLPLLIWPACSPWRSGRRNSRTLSGRSQSGTFRPHVSRPWSGRSPGSDSRWC